MMQTLQQFFSVMLPAYDNPSQRSLYKQKLSMLNETSSNYYCFLYSLYVVNLRIYRLYYFEHKSLFGG